MAIFHYTFTWVRRWKNFENRSTFVEDRSYGQLSTGFFLRNTVYMVIW